MSPFLYSIQKIEMGTYSHFFRTRTRYLIFSMGNLSNLVHIRFFKDYMNIMSICKLTTWNWIEKFDTYLKLQSLKKVHLYYYFYYLQFLFFILKILYCKQCINGCFRSKYINSKWLHLWLLNVAFLLKPILKSQNKNYFLNFNLETLYCKLVSKYLSI